MPSAITYYDVTDIIQRWVKFLATFEDCLVVREYCIQHYPIGSGNFGKCLLTFEYKQGKGWRTGKQTTDRHGRWCKPKYSIYVNSVTGGGPVLLICSAIAKRSQLALTEFEDNQLPPPKPCFLDCFEIPGSKQTHPEVAWIRLSTSMGPSYQLANGNIIQAHDQTDILPTHTLTVPPPPDVGRESEGDGKIMYDCWRKHYLDFLNRVSQLGKALLGT